MWSFDRLCFRAAGPVLASALALSGCIHPLYGTNGVNAQLAGELVQLRPDVIVAFGALAIQAAKDTTATIPVVMVIGADPVARGLVSSFARPGGNDIGVPGKTHDGMRGAASRP